MIFLGPDYPEVRDLSSLLLRMRGRLSYRARVEHCHTAAVSIYGLIDHRLSIDYQDVTFMGRVVELHLRFSNQPITLRDVNCHLLVIRWRGNGFIEIFNGPAPKMKRDDFTKTISIDELKEIGTYPETRFREQPPEMPRAYLGNKETDNIARRNNGGNGNGADGNGGNNGDGNSGAGGLTEVVGHPVLFSVELNAYRRLLEEY
ncbi:hypothetical protein [Janthinobacterium sp. J1-1]|uniref:hypothetical protein n=1 Tax=Janthinobacterium sp. J1-1 TaxID=3065910 RepID=UPI0028125069|nr:hypothetical protein [Janthinobacterium sp. J1-1]